MRKRTVLILLVGVMLVCGWYWFRPELLLLDARVAEAFPGSATAAEAIELRGTFHTVAHETSGVATVHRLEDGRRVLRLDDFATSNGPALYVYLIAAADAHDSATVSNAAFIDLGRLKGNLGAQHYELPADVDLTEYQAVTIWCKRFSVNFATAPLTRS